jgi:DNA-binding NtrC family response regulator
MAAFERYDWPGNVRELRNAVEATLLGEPVELSGAAPPAAAVIGAVSDLPYKAARQAVMSEFEARYLTRLMERAKRNVSQAARLAQMDRSYLLELLRRHALTRATGSSSCSS